MAPLRIGIAGLGTVGAGVIKVLSANGEQIAARCGRAIEIVAVAARDRNKDRGIDTSKFRWVDDPVALATDPGIDVVVELIGGEDGAARKLVEAAVAAGKGVVTANKALIAKRGVAIAAEAEKKGVPLYFEAAVAGGIPIMKALRESLAANQLTRIYGILNGTCNYILTTMEASGRDFADVLAEAQKLGYAEADPSFDIDGVDTAHKLAILASVAFGVPVDFSAIHVEGIRNITAQDIRFAAELGYRIKLLGIATRTAQGLEQRVHPCMVPIHSPVAHVEGAYNAVLADGDFVGRTVYEGSGAGAGPTASAVVADIIDIARGHRVSPFGVPTAALKKLKAGSVENRFGAYYWRLEVTDQPGVMADVAAIMRDHRVSIESVLQRGRDPGERVSVIMTLHEAEERGMKAAFAEIGRLASMAAPPCMIRIEPNL